MNTAIIHMINHDVTADDGRILAATLFYPPISRNEKTKVAIVASAMGNKRDEYIPFAKYFASMGWHVVTYDNRGIGDSRVEGDSVKIKPLDRSGKSVHEKSLSQNQLALEDWGRLDASAVIQWVRGFLNPDRLDYISHSIGGQVVGLIQDPEAIDCLILVASQNGYWPLWAFRHRYIMRFGWSVISVFSKVFKSFHLMRLAGSESLPSSIALDWKRWAMTPEFTDRQNRSLDSNFSRFKLPILAISLSDDNIYAPKPAVDSLVAKYDCADVTRWHLYPKEISAASIGHFGFFDPNVSQSLWPSVLAWLDGNISSCDHEKVDPHVNLKDDTDGITPINFPEALV